jgi:VanZ family protein
VETGNSPQESCNIIENVGLPRLLWRAGAEVSIFPTLESAEVTRARIALAALAYAALVAHLLFIPYAFSPLSLDDTLRRFALIPWLQLGSDQNVALASRGLMFVPLGLLLAAWVAPEPRRRIELPALLIASLLGCLWATGVNFAQVWFPTRTVSLNNLAAEFFGVIGGGLLWSTLGATGLRWWRKLASGGRVSLMAALSGYVALYLVASLTPFDFVTSAGEIAEKAASDLYGLWIAPVSCGPAPCELKFVSAMLAAVPCGWWFAARRRSAVHFSRSAVLFALVVATIIELLHFLMVSGVSQGASVLVRASGIVLGAATYSWRYRVAALDLNRVGRPAVVALLVPHIIAVAYVAGWFRSQKLGVAAGLARLHDVVWLPFFYQYYAPYQSTMYSAMVHAALYAPVGVMCWLWTRNRDRAPLWLATLVAVMVAIVAETSKVFLAGRLPDYTDVFIAAVSATLALAVLRFASRSQHPPRDALASPHSDAARQPRDASRRDGPAADSTPASAGPRLIGALLLALVVATVIGFPVGSWALALGLVLYVVALLRFPTAAYLIAIPSLLPVFDLAPLSGRFFWDEFDVLLATTLGVRLLMTAPIRKTGVAVPKAALWLLFVSVMASTAIGVWPPAPFDANAFSNYLSTYNALRIAKGYVWGGAVLWLICRDASAGRKVIPPLQIGLTLGLFAATISVLWERLLFAGLADLGTAFRAAGFVSATHVGGAYLEALLVMLAPFGLSLAVTAERSLHRHMWYAVVLLGAAAVLVTLSRAALVAWLISVAVFALVWWLKSREPRAVSLKPGWQWGTGMALLSVLAITVLAAQSTYLHERLAMSNSDLSLRTAHWNESIALMRSDALHVLLGMGLGSFPREFYLAHAGTQQLPAYRLERDGGSVGSVRSYLVLTGGRGMYMDQRVGAKPGSELRLEGQVRSPQAGARLSISLCEKSFLNSVTCDEAAVSAGPTWQPFEVRLRSPQRADIRFALAAPIALSLHNGVFGSRVEVTQLSLVDASQADLLSNGSFEHGLDRWLVASDVHLAWRTLNTPLQITFEQGVLGVLAWLMLCVAAIAVVLRPSAYPGVTAAFAGALIGFLAVGCFDSLLDWPRIILLVALIGAAGLNSSGDRQAQLREPSRS